MKKFFLFTVCIVMLFVTGCRSDGGTERMESLDTLQYNGSFPLYAEEGAQSPHYTCNISLVYLVSKDSLLQANVNRTIAKAAFGYEELTLAQAIEAFAANAQKEYKEILPEYLNEKEAGSVGHWFDHSYELKGEMSDGERGVWNYTIFNFYDFGGAHPTTNYIYFNIDRKTGKELELSDVFVENYEEKLDELLVGALMKKLGVTTMKEVQEKDYLTMNGMFPSKNFLLTKDSILFLYNQYDIAPYVMGQTELGFTYKELEGLLRKR